jgi:hypothetical protein
MITENLHGVNAPGTWKFQVTFRGSEPGDLRLAGALKARARRDNVNYADVVRAALMSYLGL